VYFILKEKFTGLTFTFIVWRCLKKSFVLLFRSSSFY